MAGYQRCISLALACLSLCHNSLAESTACTSRANNFAHCIFLCRHFPDRAPNTTDLQEWKQFLGAPDPNRRIQSFLKPSELGRVKAVCTDEGGQQYIDNRWSTNLCISRTPFDFLTVSTTQDSKTYRIRRERKKHLILACENVDNICLPTHFQPNWENKEPDANAKGCRGGTNYG
ncbi:unnamed protein product [Arctogadus glacialis]